MGISECCFLQSSWSLPAIAGNAGYFRELVEKLVNNTVSGIKYIIWITEYGRLSMPPDTYLFHWFILPGNNLDPLSPSQVPLLNL
ncbi:hypothetical protein ACN38_g12845 [Penicillium nordicum]|uniref:Uncharacterized protein n=1 Tax=Penicillium nordicum TaxID=229535 RepID=A0A0M8NSK0_9EURO|nr:hypothetical protein ACN38_g12845 [Penicillium nordicum]